METKSAIEIAQAIGAPLNGLLGTQDWVSPLHSGIVISQLHYKAVYDLITGEEVGKSLIPFRAVNKITEEVISKLLDENAPGDVDAVQDSMVAVHQKISFEIMPALLKAIPDLDPASPILRGLTIGGKEMVADLVDGSIQNIRLAPIPPAIFLGANGAPVVDTSMMAPGHKIAADAALLGMNMAAPVDMVAVAKTRVVKVE